MYCLVCDRPVAGQKGTNRARNTAAIGAGVLTGGATLFAGAKKNQWHCPECGTQVGKPGLGLELLRQKLLSQGVLAPVESTPTESPQDASTAPVVATDEVSPSQRPDVLHAPTMTDAFPILTDEGSRPFRPLGTITARVGAATAFSKAPTLEDVNFKLQEAALKLGANGVIRVTYKRGVTATSWKGLTASGEAVVFESDEKTCPICAETIKAAAVKCRSCGADLA